MRAVALAVALVAVGASCTPTTPTAPGPVATVTIGAESATATVTGGATVTMSMASPASLPPAPSGVVFPLGALRVTVGSVTPGAVVHVSIALTAPVTGVKKLIAGVWDPFAFDGTTGATLSGDGRTISLDLQDGGRGDSDGLANGTIVDPVAPTIEQLHAVDIGVNGGQSCALTDVGEVYCWGVDFRVDSQAPEHNYSIPFKIDGIEGATQLSVGVGHACVVTDQQKVDCWGDGTSGGLGDGLYGNHNVATPFEVPGVADVARVDAGDGGTCATTTTGALYCWGPNYWGQIMPGDYSNTSFPPTLVDIDPVVGAIFGISHVCALLATGTVSCWGNNYNAQVGSEFYVPGPLGITPLAGVTGATALTTGYVSNCVIAGDTVRCWGYNYFGNLGTGSALPPFTHVPSTVSFSSTPVDVGVNVNGGCAALADGTLSCWGINADLGTGSTDVYGLSAPATVPGLTGVTAVGVGDRGTCALHDAGISCWGSNEVGNLGDGTNTTRYVPTPVIGFG